MDRLMKFLAGGWLLSAVGTLIANTNVEEGEQGGMTEWLIALVITAVVTVALYFILRRVTASTMTALVLGALAVVSLLIFWLGLTPVLAAGAAAVALPDTKTARRPLARDGKTTAALVLAAISVVVFFIGVVIG